MALVIAFFISMPSAMAEERNVSKSYLQNMYMNYLSQQGYSPEIDSDGDVRFSYAGYTLFIAVNENDPEYIRIVLPNIWPIESNEEQLQVLIATDYTNNKIKVVKLYLNNNNTSAAIESFIAEPEDFSGIFKRSLEALEGGVMQFSRKMRSMNDGQSKTSTAEPEKKHHMPEADTSIGLI